MTHDAERMTHNNEENLKNILEKVRNLKESEISGNAHMQNSDF